MNEQSARGRILQAAIKVFAEKGFEGSRVDEISREANVPKSLIYYHFKSKNEILEVLINDFIEEYKQILAEQAKETHQQKAQSLPARMESVYYQFGQRHADLVRIILIDSLKKSTERPVLYKMLDALIAHEMSLNPDADYDVQERRVTEFFTSLLPSCAYLCFGQSWQDYYTVGKQQFDELFLKVYSETHGAYHKNHPQGMERE